MIKGKITIDASANISIDSVALERVYKKYALLHFNQEEIALIEAIMRNFLEKTNSNDQVIRKHPVYPHIKETYNKVYDLLDSIEDVDEEEIATI